MNFNILTIIRLACLASLLATQTTNADEAFISRPAKIDSIDILMLESFPVQVHVRITGTLGDSCTTLGQITQKREAGTFIINVTTRRPANAMCAQVLATFYKSVALDVVGLKAGTYPIEVNGVTETFILQTDNRLSAPP